MKISEWKKVLEEERKMKDWFFKTDPRSPIPFEDRDKFKGLNYYPIDAKYYFELELYEHTKKNVVMLMYTKGEERKFVRWGEFRFKIDNKDCTLQAYREESADETLFVPFKDLTNGKETYGAGRYIDLRREKDYLGDGRWILDFNQAYNPWCVYNEAYTCPFVPPENWLKVPIRAGEKNYPLKRGKETIKQ